MFIQDVYSGCNIRAIACFQFLVMVSLAAIQIGVRIVWNSGDQTSKTFQDR